MQRGKLRPPEPGDPMCCCECDVDQYGRCCDCEDLDEACNRWLKGVVQVQKPSAAFGGVTQRLAAPSPPPSPPQVEISVLPALILLPVLLRLAALHFLLGVAVLTALPGLALWYYRATHRRKRRTLLFLALALYSLAYMYYLFLTEILPRGDVGRPQLVTVTTGVVLTLASLIRTKRGPGFVRPDPADDAHSPISDRGEAPDGSSVLHSGSGQSDVSGGRGVGLRAAAAAAAEGGRCPVCRVPRPPRAGHCRICGACVRRLDHHCIWINSCVGQANHRSFLLTLLFFLLTSLYGISLVLGSVCPRQNILTALLYCPGVYNQYSSALCFTCAWYSSIITGGLLHLLLLQLLNVSWNVTEREAHTALRGGTGQRRLCGLAVDTGLYSRGFWHNWTEFLTMGDAAEAARPSSSTLTDVV